VQLLVNGLITGSILALTGVGASLVFGIQRIANFAHGEYLTIGAYVALVLNVALRQNLVVSAIGGMLGTALFALIAHFGLFRPLRGRGTIAISRITVGLALVIRDGSPSLSSRLLCCACGRIAARQQQRAIQALRARPAMKPNIGVCGYLRHLVCEPVREFRNCSGRNSRSRQSRRCHCQIALFPKSANAATSSFSTAEKATDAQTRSDERRVRAPSRVSYPSVQA